MEREDVITTFDRCPLINYALRKRNSLCFKTGAITVLCVYNISERCRKIVIWIRLNTKKY